MDIQKALKCAKRLRQIRRAMVAKVPEPLEDTDMPMLAELIALQDKQIKAYPARIAGRLKVSSTEDSYWKEKRREAIDETLKEVKEYIKENNI